MPHDDPHSPLRRHLLDLLGGANAHIGFDDAVRDFPEDLRGRKPSGSPHSPWQLLEHLRIAQEDILAFSKDARHQSPKWPEGYWPPASEPSGEAAWTKSVEQFRSDLDRFCRLIEDPNRDLFAPLPHAPDGQTLLREALVLADHNSYHLGQLMLLRKTEEKQSFK